MADDRLSVMSAFSAFQKKFSRFTKSEEGERLAPVRKDKVLQQEITDREERYENAVSNSYRIYKSPFEALGRNSSRAKAIDDDEQSVLKAYDLYKSIIELNEKKGDEHTFIAKYELENLIARKDSYTRGGQLVYLQCWLMFEQGITDYVPVLEEIKPGKFQLRFVDGETFRFPQTVLEQVEMIKRIYYQG